MTPTQQQAAVLAQTLRSLREAQDQLFDAAVRPGLSTQALVRVVTVFGQVAGQVAVFEALVNEQLDFVEPELPEQNELDRALPPHPARTYGLQRPRKPA